MLFFINSLTVMPGTREAGNGGSFGALCATANDDPINNADASTACTLRERKRGKKNRIGK